MAETLTVARRVAEEAIDEAIAKAEFDTSSQVIHVIYCQNSNVPVQCSTRSAALC